MQYRVMGSTGVKISALGFGCGNIPMDGNLVRVPETVELVHKAVEIGINYFDCCHDYNNFQCDLAIGTALGDVRKKVLLSCKDGIEEPSPERWLERLKLCLGRLQTDYIDFYHFWGLTWKTFTEIVDVPNGPLPMVEKAKKDGLIRQISFSFHDEPQNLFKLIDTGLFASATVQYNMLDRSNEKAIAHAKEKGVGIVVMGPIGGGRLGAPSEEIKRMLPDKTFSTAELALRFVLSNQGVSSAISGMGNNKELEENAAVASWEDSSLKQDEYTQLAAALEEKKKLADLYCTGCNYCMPCPNGVDIPSNFLAVNYYRIYDLKEYSKRRLKQLMDEKRSAVSCIECGICETKCPQRIPIVQRLKEAIEQLS